MLNSAVVMKERYFITSYDNLLRLGNKYPLLKKQYLCCGTWKRFLKKSWNLQTNTGNDVESQVFSCEFYELLQNNYSIEYRE